MRRFISRLLAILIFPIALIDLSMIFLVALFTNAVTHGATALDAARRRLAMSATAGSIKDNQLSRLPSK